jgi:tRNA pseudouridine38-40 synthase
MSSAFVRVRLDLGYDGSGFAGWASQPGQRTVEEVLRTAFATALGLAEPVLLTVAGRTDAGVHARGQVCSADVPAEAWAQHRDRLIRRLAGLLPPDIRVRRVMAVPDSFDARFSALSRRYAYRVCDSSAGVDPLRRHEVLAHRRTLDVAAMNAAATPLIGEHDFAAYCRPREGATTVRRLLALEWVRESDGLLIATVEADAFCHSMVRALVGALLAVGEGRRPVSWPAAVLAAGVRDPAVTVVAPHGLTLEEVRYPPYDQLAARAVETRRVRALGG